jgi:hypothetical protein
MQPIEKPIKLILSAKWNFSEKSRTLTMNYDLICSLFVLLFCWAERRFFCVICMTQNTCIIPQCTMGELAMYSEARWEREHFAGRSKTPPRQNAPTWLIYFLLLLSPLFWTLIAVSIAIHVQKMDVYLNYVE